MATLRLTKKSMEAIKANDSPFVAYDTDLVGFGVRVMPSGYKSWIVEYRPGVGGRLVAKKRMTLGSTTKVTAELARRKAKEILAQAQLGSDPAGERNKSRRTPTFREFSERYLVEEAEPKLKPKTVVNYRIYFRKHANPVIGSLKLDDITKADIARLHRKIGQTKQTTANRVLESVSSVYRYAATAGEIEEGFNPARGIKHFRERARERFLSMDELQRLGASLRLAETEGLPWELDEKKRTEKHLAKPENRQTTFSPYVIAAIRLLLFTGCRLREILHMKWEDIDFDRGLLLLPESKTGKRFVVLNGPALNVLNELERFSAYVIMADNPDKPRSDLKRPWDRITKHAGLDGLRNRMLSSVCVVRRIVGLLMLLLNHQRIARRFRNLQM